MKTLCLFCIAFTLLSLLGEHLGNVVEGGKYRVVIPRPLRFANVVIAALAGLVFIFG